VRKTTPKPASVERQTDAVSAPMSEARGLKRRPLASRSIPWLKPKTKPKTVPPPARLLHKSIQKGAIFHSLPFPFLQAHPWIGKHSRRTLLMLQGMLQILQPMQDQSEKRFRTINVQRIGQWGLFTPCGSSENQ
jgi:hypothetical protein